MHVVAVAAANFVPVHLALQKRAVHVHLVQDLTVGVVQVRFQNGGDDVVHQVGAGVVVVAQLAPPRVARGTELHLLARTDLARLDQITDEMHREVWRMRYGRKKQAQVILDIDSHIHHVYGDQKQGTDFTHKGKLGYHPLVISLADTQECLRLINRPGNVTSAEGAAAAK